jgi:hypothetical protein
MCVLQQHCGECSCCGDSTPEQLAYERERLRRRQDEERRAKREKLLGRHPVWTVTLFLFGIGCLGTAGVFGTSNGTSSKSHTAYIVVGVLSLVLAALVRLRRR